VRIEKDYEELLRLFHKYKARYCIVGAYAVAYYSRPRYTKDLDLFIDPTPENARKIIKSLNEFGFKRMGLRESDFAQKGRIIQLGYDPIRVDIVTSIDGCTFKEVWRNKASSTYGRQKVYFIGKKELIKNKKAAKRKIDKIDLEYLLV